MGNITSVYIQEYKPASSEIHNRREKDLSYVREDLSHMNESIIHGRIIPALSRIEDTNTKATGQKLQPSAPPIKEAVLVIREDTTMEEAKRFVELCHQEFGITPIHYHIHKDEGHYDTYGEPCGNVWQTYGSAVVSTAHIFRMQLSCLHPSIPDCRPSASRSRTTSTPSGSASPSRSRQLRGKTSSSAGSRHPTSTRPSARSSDVSIRNRN